MLLDLHSFNAKSQPFCMVGPRNNDGALQPFQHEAKERALARRLGVLAILLFALPASLSSTPTCRSTPPSTMRPR